MTSSIRKFDNFADFPGQINTETMNYEYPKLFKYTDKGQLREWTIYIRLIKKDSKNISITKKQNWDMMAETQIEIKGEYLNDDHVMNDGILSQVWSETGVVDMKISRHAANYPKIKNKGRANERGVFHTALVFSRSKYLKKIDEGYRIKANIGKTIKVKEKMYKPMLALKYEDFENKIKYPVYIQPKLDGVRWVIFLNLKGLDLDDVTYENVIIYSRQQKEYPYNKHNNNIRKALLRSLKNYYDIEKKESLYLDGESYGHGTSLQDINSVSKASKGKSKKNKKDIKIIKFHFYDAFYPSFKDEQFLERYEILEEAYGGMNDDEKKYVELVDTLFVETKKEQTNLFRQYTAKKYEGIMIRSPEGVYKKHLTSKSSALRSKQLLKRKKVMQDEFEVVGYTEGTRGKDVGAIIWVCLAGEKTFNVTPTGDWATHKERYRIFAECEKNNGQGFIDKYQGRMLTVEYRSMSKDGVPQHAKAIIFRDYL